MAARRELRRGLLTAALVFFGITLPLGGCLAVNLYVASGCTVREPGVAAPDLGTLRDFQNAVRRADDYLAMIESGRVMMIEAGVPGRVLAFGSIFDRDGDARKVKLGGAWHGRIVWMKAGNLAMNYPPSP